MKKQLDFNIQFSNLWTRESFPNCLAGVHAFLEGLGSDVPRHCDPKGENARVCFGCGGCGDPEPVSVYFCLFDTMCGRSAVRLRYDGTLTRMAGMIGDSADWSGKCAVDYTTDFLFGFTGYGYRKVTDPSSFVGEAMASIDAGKPVIAESKADGGGFIAVTGYDGGEAIRSYYAVDQGENRRELIIENMPYDGFKALYFIGDRADPRHTLRDGLERIRLVMENNAEERVWDKGIEQINRLLINPTDEEYSKTDPDNFKELQKRFADTTVNRFNNHTFSV
ncbi:MAG: hypothetical protein FWE70_03700, partial [Oscillospiraceae bacterium]|nr:hypothetical protein [Oscillospiraceae bacterium]